MLRRNFGEFLAVPAGVVGILGGVAAAFTVSIALGAVIAAVSVAVSLMIWWYVVPVEVVLRQFPGFRATNPQDLKRTYQAIETWIDRDYPPPDSSATGGYVSRQNDVVSGRLATIAARYTKRADMHWGRPSARRQLRAAWLYAAAGYIHERSAEILLGDEGVGGPRERRQVRSIPASMNYHYAANAFRGVESFEQAIKHYERASRIDDRHTWKVRGLERAIGVAEIAGSRRVDELRQELDQLTGPSDDSAARADLSAMRRLLVAILGWLLDRAAAGRTRCRDRG